ncbi:hypothetical protein N7462_003973 [Penicillium macrosclerotiorum]|uniref:uncharacterized protein n=1 Tax=Penicillium macrosclerotiorum TaxID=303699 RepID=UPI00254997CC|nr:uncharacterized protein N7462_003973 [Penicillium macrosclerotiorum]KAJ5689581.1 hypothetical protein N7462_003973 [Penicillium macrosclerotiorum]
MSWYTWGVSSAMISTPCMAVLSHWFHQRRGTATGIAMAGSSLGGVVFPLALRPALERLGWAWALRILGFFFMLFLVIGNICIRSRLPIKKQNGSISVRYLTDSRFIWATVGVFFSEIVLFASLGLIPTYAAAQGFDSQTGFYLLAVMNAYVIPISWKYHPDLVLHRSNKTFSGSGFGRWLSGTASDHLGRFNTISAMMLTTTFLIFVLWYPFGHQIGVLYTFVWFLGFGTGSILSLTPVCVGQICKTEEFGQWVGTCYFIASFGTLIGIPIGGQLLQAAGPSRLVVFLGVVLAISLSGFLMSRWACLGYKWKWGVKI